MDFGEILRKAWKTIWKHKILWLFGVLAGCGTAASGGGGGSGGGGTSRFQFPSQNGPWNGPRFMDPSTQRGVVNFFRTLADVPVVVWVLIVLALVVIGFILSILFLLVGTLGTAGVIKGASLADDADADAKPISFSDIFNGIKPYYWKVFLLNLGVRVVGFFAGILLVLPIILFTVCTCFLGLFLLIPIGWFINLMINFTTIAIIEEEQPIFKGIGLAWQVITRKLGYVVVMFLILGIGQLIIGVIISLPLFIAPVPFVLNLFTSGFDSIGVGLILSVILFMVFIPVVIFLSGVLKAYVLTSWTLTYHRLTGEDELHPTVLSDEVEVKDE